MKLTPKDGGTQFPEMLTRASRRFVRKYTPRADTNPRFLAYSFHERIANTMRFSKGLYKKEWDFETLPVLLRKRMIFFHYKGNKGESWVNHSGKKVSDTYISQNCDNSTCYWTPGFDIFQITIEA